MGMRSDSISCDLLDSSTTSTRPWPSLSSGPTQGVLWLLELCSHFRQRPLGPFSGGVPLYLTHRPHCPFVRCAPGCTSAPPAPRPAAPARTGLHRGTMSEQNRDSRVSA